MFSVDDDLIVQHFEVSSIEENGEITVICRQDDDGENEKVWLCFCEVMKRPFILSWNVVTVIVLDVFPCKMCVAI